MSSGIVQVLAAIIFGASIMVVSMYRLWKPSPECQEHRLKLPLGIEFEGCSIWGAIFFGGLLIFSVGIGLDRGGQDTANLGSRGFFISTAYAQTQTVPFCNQQSGWVYTGTGVFSDRWWFELVEGVVPEDVGPVSSLLVLRAESVRNLRADHYSSLTGTWMGRLLGIKPPQTLCKISTGKKVLVKEFVSVGQSRIWAKVNLL